MRMPKTLAVLLFLILAAFTAHKLIKTKIADGITVSLPREFYPMTPEDMAQRFPSVRAPLGAYTNEDRLVDFSVNISATKWPDGDIDMAQKFFKTGLYNLYDKLDMISEGTVVSRKKRFIFFEFDSRLSGDRQKQAFREPVLKYTFIQYLVKPNRTLVFSFTCPKSQKEEWQAMAREIMKTVRVK